MKKELKNVSETLKGVTAQDKKMVIVFTADSNLMCDSYRSIGVCDSIEKAIDLLIPRLEMVCISEFKEQGYNNSGTMLNDLTRSLRDIQQTQTLSENFVLEVCEINTLK